jgi:Domain of unknown function (DUF5666)
VSKHLIQAVTVLVASLSLVACGGGTDSSAQNPAGSSSTSTKELASGTVTGFGSVYVEGVKYEDSSVRVSIEHDSTAPKNGAISDVKLGMKVALATDARGHASSVVVSSEVIGSISALAADGFVVAGQTVKVSSDPAAPTVFDHVAGLSGLAVNDRVEVHGSRDANNQILATRIERKDPNSSMLIRVVGTIASLDSNAGSFSLAGLNVNFNAATRVRPQGTVLANGQTVAVWTDTAPAGNTLGAKSITLRVHGAVADDKLRVGGHIRALDFATKTFKLDGFDVDAASASFANGTVSDLANGRKIRVQGKFVAGKLLASELRFIRDQGDATVQLSGAISDFVSAASFKLRGVPVDASAPGVVFVDGGAANLADGVAIQLVGQVENNVVKPSRIEFANSENSGSGLRTFFGTVSAYSASTGAFTLLGVNMKLQDSTTFRRGNGGAASRTDFGNLDRVRVKGSWSTGLLNVSEVVFEPAPSLVINRAEGGVYEFDATTGNFKINGTLVTVGSSTVFEGGRTNLRNGVKVEVEGTWVDGKLVARKVEIKRADDSITVSVRGEIADWVSASEFRVAGQRVNASAARFNNGSAANLANGRIVEAHGTVLEGVLNANEVTFK